MEQQTAAPAQARVAPVETREAQVETRESPAFAEFVENVWSGTAANDALTPNKFAARAGEPTSGSLDFSVNDPLKAFRADTQFRPEATDGRLQTAHLRAPESRDNKVQPDVQETRRLIRAVNAMEGGDVSQLSQFVKEMNDPSNPRRQQELAASMKYLTDIMNKFGLDSKVTFGNLSITLPGRDGKTLTIDSNGRANLSGDALKNFGKKFNEQFADKDMGDGISNRTSRRLDGIHDDLEDGNLRGLIAALKEIGDKIHSVKPGAAGALERKTAKELQTMLGFLGNELSTRDVDARYDPQTGNFKVTQPNRNGVPETLTIDKYGRPSLSGADLSIFLFRMKIFRSRQETVPV